MTKPKIEFYQLRDFGSKMNATVDFLRENMGRLFLNLLFIVAPIGLILGILISSLFSSIGDMTQVAGEGAAINFLAVLGGNYFLLMLVSWLAISMIVSITYTYIRLYNQGLAKETAVTDVLKLSLQKYGGVLLLGFVITLVVMLGFVFFILPGIFFAITLSLAYPIYVFEDVPPMQAFGRSFALIKEKWWSTFGVIFVTGLMAYVVQTLFSLPFMAVYLFEVFSLVEEVQNNPEDPSAIFDMLGSGYVTAAMAISAIGTYLTYSIPLIGVGYQYANLVERSEGRGLMNEIEAFDKKD